MIKPDIFIGLSSADRNKSINLLQKSHHIPDVNVIYNMEVKEILKHCSNCFNIPIKEILGNSRKKEIVIARDIAIFYINKVLKNLKKTGAIFGKDHSTIIYSRDKFLDLYGLDKQFTNYVNEFLKHVCIINNSFSDFKKVSSSKMNYKHKK